MSATSRDASVDAVRQIAITRWTAGASSPARDAVAHEEPLEIQLQGASLAVVMRTPGHDPQLVTGFLVTERILRERTDIVSMRHCSSATDPDAEENIMRVVLAPHVPLALEQLRRNLFASSSCGICGKATIEAALAHGPPVISELRIAADILYALPDLLRAAQPTFAQTGGLHAAGLFDDHGQLLGCFEDVGRHNAVDKAIGESFSRGRSGAGLGLFVSGRISMEVVQKAAAFGVAVVAGISAPTSLAVRLGEALGITVVGFVRASSANVYSHSERIC